MAKRPPPYIKSTFIAAGIGAMIMPPVFLSIMVARYGVNVPFWDQWDFVPVLKKANESQLTFADLWAQHNEHRLVFPRILMLGLAMLTQWNTRWEMATSLFLAMVAFTLLLGLIKSTFYRLGSAHLWAFIIPLSLLTFSPIQWGNWLWGWQIQWFLNVLAVIASVAALSKISTDTKAWPYLLTALTFATIAQFSLANGTVVWVSFLPLFWIKRPLRRLVVVWILSASLMTGLYFKNYSPPGHSSELGSAVEEPVENAVYLLNYLGSPLRGVSRPEANAIGYKEYDASEWRAVMGAILLGVFTVTVGFIAWKKQQVLEYAAPWVAIALYALMSAAVTTVGRRGLGLEQAASSRYTTVATLFVIATLALLALAFETAQRANGDHWGIHPLVFATLILVVSFSLSNYGDAVGAMQKWSLQRQEGKTCLETARSEDAPCLNLTYPDGEVSFQQSRYLREIGWGGLAQR